MHVATKILVVVISAILMSSGSLLIRFSRSRSLSYTYSPYVAVLLVECMKFFFSGAMLYMNSKSKIDWPEFSQSWRFALPSLIYVAQNNIWFVALLYLDPPTFQVLSNFKILSTALLMRLVLGRSMTSLQWVALVILMLGAMSPSLPEMMRSESESTDLSVQTVGFLLVLVQSSLSGLSSVYTEFVLKSSTSSIYVQNLYLYGYGILINGLVVLYDQVISNGDSGSLLAGFTTYTYFLCLIQALNGMVVGVIMKYCDSMVKIFAYVFSMLVTILVSSLLFDFVADLPFLFGFCLVILATFLYHHQVFEKAKTPSSHLG